MKSIFNPENWFWHGFALLADFFILSACWLLCSLPVVTLGSATIALYDAVAHGLRMKQPGMYRRFFRTFRQELLRGGVLTLICAAAALLLNILYQTVTQLAGEAYQILSIACFFAMLLPLGWVCWIVALESRFTSSLGQLLKNGLKFTIGHLPYTIAIVLIYVLALNLCQQILFLLMVVPGCAVYLQSWFVERVFRKYMPDNESDSTEIET